MFKIVAKNPYGRLLELTGNKLKIFDCRFLLDTKTIKDIPKFIDSLKEKEYKIIQVTYE